jgi:hypothetical protein
MYLALITHKCAQMRGLVPRRCSGVNDNAPRVCRWSKHEGGETRSLILEDDTTIRIFGGIDEARLRRKQQKVFNVRVPCEVPGVWWGKAGRNGESCSVN